MEVGRRKRKVGGREEGGPRGRGVHVIHHGPGRTRISKRRGVERHEGWRRGRRWNKDRRMGCGCSGIAEERGMNRRRRRANMKISREEERAAMAARFIHCLLPKLLLLASLPALPSLILLRELMPPVAFHGVWTCGRVRGRGREVVAVLVRCVTVRRAERQGSKGRQRRREARRAGRGGLEGRSGFVEGAGSDEGRLDLE